ncbi:alpha-L-arabinofuranosidase C-terminal domain-containing protein [Aquibacillus saliphilus]|uniref:alpha-L-arabinofuranosidase C-terminal domain-containing protein n=1 Tax=Aquibacillus saliphilus TaxID=1909422 RepID=UPI001CF0AC5F|nr:alpha-L-arabinofuranosidase C-terminal domain-containing protein [Aquibacillus saliphilus]
MKTTVDINSNRILGNRNEMIYGHFIEHFHRQIYGGLYDPGNSLSDDEGFRTDVIEALTNINIPIVRWPGGCFVSNYPWKDGVGKYRVPFFDKAWRVEESNQFGTDEFVSFSKKIGAEPYICTNAGTGSSEDMSDWVEYCNLKDQGKWANLRAENGHRDPFHVKYWSIGNENYGDWEMGAKDLKEWGRFVRESAKMMKRVDPSIELFAASISDLDWNLNLLREAGKYLDWISIHGYWDTLNESNELSDYETCMTYTLEIEPPILKTKHILGSLGYLGKIRIAFDEWNLRGWHHPHVNSATEDYLSPRDKNDLNASYTMADAVFTACFLNQCLKHCDVVGMANFSPTVNTRGAIFTHPDGIVLRSTYFVFELFTKYMGDQVIDSWVSYSDSFTVEKEGNAIDIPSLDIVATKQEKDSQVSISIVNRHPDQAKEVTFRTNQLSSFNQAKLYSVLADSKDAYNDVEHPNEVSIDEKQIPIKDDGLTINVAPHSVNVLVLR